MKKTIIYITAALLAASCIYPFNPDINTETGRDLVVDGKIVLGGTSTVSLSYIADLNRTKESSIRPKGKAWIEDSAGNKYESDNNALTDKISINTTALPKGLQYRTVVSLDGEIYSSEWLDAEAPPVINRIFFEPDQNYVHVSVNVSVPESRSGYMGFSFEECWEFHSDFIPEFVVNTQTWSYAPLMATWKFYWCYMYDSSRQTSLVDYTLMENVDNINVRIHSFPRTDNRNHRRYSILVNTFALSDYSFRYIKQAQDMSELGGDLFSPDPGMLQGNFHCETSPEKKVYGLSRACEVSSKREYLDGIYLIDVAPSEGSLVEVEKEAMPKYYFDLSYRPVKTVSQGENSFVGWGPIRCIDCTAAGGTQETPEFWKY